jgi:HK97 family phage prohead protease
MSPFRKSLDLKRVFAEDDRLAREFEQWELERSQRTQSVVGKASYVETADLTQEQVAYLDKVAGEALRARAWGKEPEPDPRIERSYADGVEKVWISGWSRSSRCMIHGMASTSSIVSDNNTVLLTRGCELSVPVPLMWRHTKLGGPIGEVVYMQKDKRGIYIRAALFTHEASQHVWKLIALGEISGLSVGCETAHILAETDVRFYDKWKIKEISITPAPANNDCHFEIYNPLKRTDDDQRSRKT